MKKTIKNYTEKSAKELEAEITKMRLEIAKGILEAKSNPVKDTNHIFKKKKQLAVLLTLATQKKLSEKTK